MLQYDTRALARPQHLFDLPALAAHALAALGTAALALAHALDERAARRDRLTTGAATRPRDRLGPRPFEPAEHGVTDAWRVR